MTVQLLAHTHYEETNSQVSWRGVSISDDERFVAFMANDVTSRLHDEEGTTEFEAHLRGLINTGFARESLDMILSADIPEERDWAVGEAMAESYLTREYHITWPWNMGRDKRNPNASLAGADLVGFEIKGEDIRLTLGEVKTSSDSKTPPNVMNGRSGMIHQIDNLANNLSLINQLLRWLLFRCKGTEHEASFNKAITLFLSSGNKAIALFGVIIRDTQPNVHDLRARGQSLATRLQAPTTCQLIAIHLPCAISTLPAHASGCAS